MTDNYGSKRPGSWVLFAAQCLHYSHRVRENCPAAMSYVMFCLSELDARETGESSHGVITDPPSSTAIFGSEARLKDAVPQK